jgi:tetratricopeptide (TPR) repeat protein
VDNRAEARTLLQQLREDLRNKPNADVDLTVRILVALGMVEAEEREHRRAIAYFEEAVTLAVDLDQRRRAVLLHALAFAYQESSDFEGAVRAGRDSLALYRAADAQHEVAVVENQLALAYLASGNITRAGALAGHARMRHELDNNQRALGHVADTQARIAIAENRFDDAITLAKEARELAKKTGNLATYSEAMLTIARAQAASGDTDAAIQSYRTGVGELRERGPVNRLQQGLTEWGDVLAKAGRHEEAYALTREALEAGSKRASTQTGTIRKARGDSPAAGKPEGARSTAPARSRSRAKVT